jgi:hypothetical protein
MSSIWRRRTSFSSLRLATTPSSRRRSVSFSTCRWSSRRWRMLASSRRRDRSSTALPSRAPLSSFRPSTRARRPSMSPFSCG